MANALSETKMAISWQVQLSLRAKIFKILDHLLLTWASKKPTHATVPFTRRDDATKTKRIKSTKFVGAF